MNRRITAWLAILGMALNALWPLLANAAPQQFVGSICSVNGMRMAPAVDPGKPAQPVPAKSFAPHCPFCSGVSDHTPGLAPSAAPLIVVETDGFHPLFAATPVRVSFVHPSAHPRGPPSPAV